MKFEVDLSVTENGRKRPEYTLNTDLKGEITLGDLLEFTKSALIITADKVLREEQDMGFDKDPVVVVDGREGKPVRDVRPLGKIEFVSRANMTEIIRDTYAGILGRAPVLTGRYKRSNIVAVNGKEVAHDLASLESWLATNPEFDEKDLIRFVNTQPYARKLERLGVTGQRTQSRTVLASGKKARAKGTRVSAPNGTYFLTARSIRSKYKRNSIIKFTYISGAGLKIAGNFKPSKKGKPGRPYLYPSIVISVKQGGTI